MFICSDFKVKDLHVQLVMPELKFASRLLQIINEDRAALERWLPWSKNMKETSDEREFVKGARQNIVDYEGLVLVILVDNQPAGTIDLHNINSADKYAEIGYWLGSKFQGQGIVTKSLQHLVDIAFKEFKLHKLMLFAEHTNYKSRAVAERAHFSHEALLKDQVKREDGFKDMDMYSMINPAN